MDKKAFEIIQENIEYEHKVKDLLKDLPIDRQGMVLSSLLVKVAVDANMSRKELLDIVDILYSAAASNLGFN